MSKQPLYQGSIENAILEVLDVVFEEAFGDRLSTKPIHELVPAELTIEDIVDIGEGFKSHSPSMGLLNLATAMHNRSLKEQSVWTSWILTTLHLHDNPSEVKILFQGGFVRNMMFAFNATSMGIIHDIMVPRGFVSSLTMFNMIPFFKRGSIDSDVDNSSTSSPFISVYETQGKHMSSKMNQLLSKIPSHSFVESSGAAFASELEPTLILSPRHGKTIISVKSNLYSRKPKSKCATFMMPGETRPWKLEVSVPAPDNIKHAFDVLKEAIDIPSNLVSNVEVTGTIGGGVDIYLALELARQKFRPDSSVFNLVDIVRSNPVVSEVLNELKTNYPQIEFDVANQLKGAILKKL
ncbi:MAG: hypothetical protein ACTSV2_08945 [Candidatus Thorarchaeota archaeon]